MEAVRREDSASKEDPQSPEMVETSQPFVGRWNRLVSTTNWEKGRIIHQWRQALIEAGAPASDYADESWVRMVGGVTGQHAGRLRRVFERYGDVWEKYEGLFWSHFQAALDWEDAEMWLEGAVQSHWSVSQMRRTRWETLGAVAADQPRDEDIVPAELDEDFAPARNATTDDDRLTPRYAEVPGSGSTGPLHEGPDFGDDGMGPQPFDGSAGPAERFGNDADAVELVRPFENLAALPDDLAAAFDAFKLAILVHKTEGWTQVGRDDVLGSLEALKALVLAPSSETEPA